MWITIGVNTTADYDAMAGAAAHLYEDGGVSSPRGGGPGGGPPGGFPPGGGPPGGGFPGFSTTTSAGSEATAKPWGPCVNGTEKKGE